MKILLLGAEGQIGWELWRSLATVGEVIALTRQASIDRRKGPKAAS
jgi:dTDP-4-dehydrorhamnose reductase